MQDSNKRNDHLQFDNFSEEGYKLLYDTFKHMTTLSTGSIIILATFLDKFFSNPEWKILISIAFILFIVSMVTAVVMMLMYSNLTGNRGQFSDTFANIAQIAAIFCMGGFVLGIISLAIFSIKNF